VSPGDDPNTAPPATGTQYTIPIPGTNFNITVTAPDSDFDYISDAGKFVYKAAGDGNVYLEIFHLNTAGQTADTVAPGFLDSYVPGVTPEYWMNTPVGGSSIQASDYVTAENGEVGARVWLINTPDGVMVILASYDTANAAAELWSLYGVINSMTMG